MDRKSILENISVAFAAQGVSMLASVVMSLLVPKVLGVTNYGYWQLFVFYTSYSGFFHLGLNDGVYLLAGGTPRDKINKKKINSQFRFAASLQLVVCLIIAMISAGLAPEGERAFVLFAFSVYTAIYNLSGYLGYVFQAMNETKLFSISTMLDRTVFLVPMVAMLLLGVDDFKPFVCTYLLSRTCCLAYCCYHAKDILQSGAVGLRASVRLSIGSIAIGYSLMLANICDSLILGATRFFIDAAWGIEAFGSVSFALSMVNFFIVFVSQAAMVLFPALRQGTQNEQRSFYVAARDAMEIIFPVVYLLYFPICTLLSLWLPQYASSMPYFAMLLPICVFNTKMNICCTTYFKVMRLERLLLGVNVVTLVVSVFIAAMAIWGAGSMEAAIMGTVLCIMGRSLWCERYLNGLLKAEGCAAPIAEAIVTIVFVALALLLDHLVAAMTYAVLYLGYLLLFRKTVRFLLHRLKR